MLVLARVVAALVALAPAVVTVHDTHRPAPAAAMRQHTPQPQLPRGGRHILGHYRVVAYYGGAGGPQLGILGSKSPDRIAADIARTARRWRGYGRPVQPAMELIATVARAGAGRDGTYSTPVPNAVVRHYVRAAHRHKLLLILDIQPGRARFIDQVKHFAPFLRDPWVSVALDPEWKMTGSQVPGRVVGHTDAAPVNLVRRYLARVVAHYDLPDKLLVLHQFRTEMIVGRDRIRPAPGVEVVFHADGFGTPSAKLATWRRLAFPHRPFGAGFKLFTRQDSRLMTPREVMALRPRPDLISYQ